VSVGKRHWGPSRIRVKITVSLVATPSRLTACYQRPSSAPNMEAATRVSYRENLISYLE